MSRYPGGILSSSAPTVSANSAKGIWTLDEAMRYSRAGQWPVPTGNGDPYFQYNSILLPGQGTNGAQNNTFLDSSTNNFTITRNGNTTQGTFTPFSQADGYWSTYFGGSDYLSVANNSLLDLGTGDYTIEGWWYFNDTSNQALVSKYSVNNGFVVQYQSGNLRMVLGTGSSDSVYTFAWTPTVGTWNHIAITRSGSNGRAFVNGIQIGSTTTFTTSNTGNSSALTLGFTQTTSEYTRGYLSNFRLTKGAALYTSNFTPSTTPLTQTSQGASATQVELIACQSNRFIDNSSNAFAISTSGSPQVTPFEPFGAPTSAYSASTVGGSGYFDGSGDYLTATANNAFNFGTGDFTVEGWFYPSAVDKGIWSNGPTSAGSFGISINGTGKLQLDYYGGTSLAGATTVNLNSWNYFAFVRSGSTLSIYLNGVRDATTTTSSNNTTNDFILGRSWTNYTSADFNGYISGFRVSDAYARYTGTTMTVPTAPLTNDGNTSVLLNFTNAGIIDNAEKNDLETVGNAQISTSQYKWGASSIYFDGTGDYLYEPSNVNFQFGTGDFTIEFWLYLNSTSGNQVVYDNRIVNGAYPAIYVGSGVLYYYVSTANRITGPTLSTSTWYHIAVSRSASSTKMFVNGNQVGSTYADTTNYLLAPLRIGADDTPGAYLNGYVADLRVTKGQGRYLYNFTAPTAAFPLFYQAAASPSADPYFENTTLLLPGNGTNGAQNNTFLDSSTNAFSITRNGNTTQGTFTPFSKQDGAWGNYFDGNGDYLTVANNVAFQFGTGDFTCEAWVYPTATPATNYTQIVGMQEYGSSASWVLGIDTNLNLRGLLQTTSPVSSTDITGGQVSLNQWSHVAMARSGTVFSLFINGVRVATTTTSQNIDSSGNNLSIGADTNGDEAVFTGYISNVRVIKGTAAYNPSSLSFTVPTTPLTAVSGTSLLTCQSNRFIDNSTNAFAITRNGDVSVQTFSPFPTTAAYSAGTNGGSGYFDASGDYLSCSQTTPFSFGTGDFCVETWAYITQAQGSGVWYPIFDTRPQNSTNGAYPILGFQENTRYVFAGPASSPTISTYAVPIGTWVQVVWTRVSGVTRCFIDGVLRLYNGSDTTNYTVGGNGIRIGAEAFNSSPNATFPGYFSDYRVLKGGIPSGYSTSSTTVGATIFTPPTAPLTAVTNTSLLLNYTNGGIIDNTMSNDLETVGNASISTAQSKFGGSSMYFDGTTDCLFRATSPNFGYGTGDFTIEFWVYLNAVGTQTLVSNLASSGSTAPHIYYLSGSGLKYYTASAERISGPTLSTGTWYHIAVSRYSGSTRMFVNGSQVGSTYADSNNYDATAPLGVGDYGSTPTGSNTLNGYINDLRITKGIARYTTNFTPPATAFLTL